MVESITYNNGFYNEGEDCYILEVDLEYPKQLHGKHDYPLAPELKYVKANSVSPHQVELFKTKTSITT